MTQRRGPSRHPRPRRSAAIALGALITVGLTLAGAISASAYTPTPEAIYTATNPQSCNKRPCVLYPKSAQLPSGRIVATYEDSQSPVVGQTLPIRASDDGGATWRKIADVKSPAALSTSSAVQKYTSNWTNPYLYVLPQAVGPLTAGTLMLASVVSGDDAYYNEQKAANPNWTPSGDGDRRDLAIALYSSADSGVTWTFQNIIAPGGWQGGSAGSIGRTSRANSSQQVDPVWEPYLMVYNGQLVAYYSDENDYLGYNTSTGVPTLDPNNATAPDSHGQILVHRTWTGSGAWSQPVVDVAGLTEDRGNGKTQIGGGRPGMETVVPTTDGKWLVTYEYFGGGDNVHYKIAVDPLKFSAAGGAVGDNITALPASGPALSTGGSPVLTTLPGGRIVYNAAGSGNVWVNDSGRSDGTWKAYQTTVPGGYSRNLQPLPDGRVLILQAAWAGNSVGPVVHADVDLGRSSGAYYSIINRKTGQYLSTDADKTQDVNLSGDQPDIISWTNNPANPTQRWHALTSNGITTFLNKGGGRALGLYFGRTDPGTRLVQWVDDRAADKQWKLVPTSDGYAKIQSTKDPSVYITGSAGYGGIDIQKALTGADGQAQEWKLVQQ